jgi:hypothetical protein
VEVEDKDTCCYAVQGSRHCIYRLPGDRSVLYVLDRPGGNVLPTVAGPVVHLRLLCCPHKFPQVVHGCPRAVRNTYD